MYELEFPWALLLLPAPLLVWWLLRPYREAREAVRVPFFEQVARSAGVEPRTGAVVARRTLIQGLTAVLCWALIVLAAAGPVRNEPPIERTESGRDLMLAVDLSGSMETRDFIDAQGQRSSRLDAVKRVIAGFIEQRDGDRIGLIFFGTAAFLQAPFTGDRELVRLLLDEAEVGMAGPQTVVGDAIGLAIRHFEQSDADRRVMVLLTDGNDTGSRVPPAKAAEIAADNDITIHVVGVGDPASAGEAPLDLELLQGMAASTGGELFLAADREQLAGIYDRIGELEPRELDVTSWRPQTRLYFLPAAAALLLALLFHGLTALRTWIGRPQHA